MFIHWISCISHDYFLHFTNKPKGKANIDDNNLFDSDDGSDGDNMLNVASSNRKADICTVLNDAENMIYILIQNQIKLK